GVLEVHQHAARGALHAGRRLLRAQGDGREERGGQGHQGSPHSGPPERSTRVVSAPARGGLPCAPRTRRNWSNDCPSRTTRPTPLAPTRPRRTCPNPRPSPPPPPPPWRPASAASPPPSARTTVPSRR